MWNSGSSDSELEFNSSKKKGKKNKNKRTSNSNSPKANTSTTTLTTGQNKIGTSINSKSEYSEFVDFVKPENLDKDSSIEKPVALFSSTDVGDDDKDDDDISDSSSDESSGMGMGRQALGLDADDIGTYDGTTAPQNGSQYLLSVMQELRRTPKIKVADINQISSKLKEKLTVNYLDRFEKEVSPSVLANNVDFKQLIPTMEWRERKVIDFSLLRSKIDRWRELLSQGVTKLKTDKVKLPTQGNKVVWQRFCFGIKFEEIAAEFHKKRDSLTVNDIVKDYFEDLKDFKSGSLIKTENESIDSNPLSPGSITTTDNAESTSDLSTSTSENASQDTMSDGNQPLMSVMLTLSQKQIMELIYYQSDWINRLGFINKCQGEWLYALLACVDKPLEPSTMGDIRHICKLLISARETFCALLRNRPVLSNCDGDVDKLSDDFRKEVTIDADIEYTSCEEEYLNALHLFIYLIGDYFCQKDLVSNFD